MQDTAIFLLTVYEEIETQPINLLKSCILFYLLKKT